MFQAVLLDLVRAYLLTKFSDYVLKFSEIIEWEHMNPPKDVKLYVAVTNYKLSPFLHVACPS